MQIFADTIGIIHMNKIGVFCSACAEINEVYFEKTKELGKWIGSNNKTLVYGGANLGLMECIAAAVKENGGEVIGVIPEKLEKNGKVSSHLTKAYYTKDLSDRKDLIVREADVLVALPGGVGTFDEIFHVMAAASIGYHNKKVIFYNINGFYDTLLVALKQLETAKFTRQPLDTYYRVAGNFRELTTILS